MHITGIGITHVFSSLTDFGVCGYLAGKLCHKIYPEDIKFWNVYGVSYSNHSPLYFKTAIKVTAFAIEAFLCIVFFPIALYVELGLSLSLHLISHIIAVKNKNLRSKVLSEVMQERITSRGVQKVERAARIAAREAEEAEKTDRNKWQRFFVVS